MAGAYARDGAGVGVGAGGKFRPFWQRRPWRRQGSFDRDVQRISARLEPLYARSNVSQFNASVFRIAQRWGCDPVRIKRQWTLYDILDALETIDLEIEAETIARQESQRRHRT